MQVHNQSADSRPIPGPVPRLSQPRHAQADFARRTVVAVLITVLILAIAYVLWRGVHVLLQAFAGVLFAVLLASLSQWLSRYARLPYGLALAIVVILLFAFVGGLGWLLANRLASQIAELTQKLPQSFSQLREYLSQYAWGRLLLEQVPNAANTLAEVTQFTRITGLISGVANVLVTGVVILFVGFFGAAEPALYRRGLLHLVPPGSRRRVGEALDAVVFNLRWWLVGQVALMVIIGASTTLGLWLLGVPLALALGVIAGILEVIPYVGAWISAVPAVMIALLLSPVHVLAVGGLYLGLHILEGYVLLPIIQRRAVEMPPALTLVTQVLLGDLLGIMGLFVAAPLTVTGVVLLKMLYVEDTLGDENVDVPGERANEAKPAAKDK